DEACECEELLHARNAPRRPKHPRHRFVTVLSQTQREAGAPPGLAPDLDPAAEQARVLLGDRQAEARAASAAGGVGLVEALEQVRQVLGRDAGPLVGDLDEGARVFAADAN